MITRCPACGTAFRVSDEQIAARSGRVRCGQCAAVFDARTALVTEPMPPAPPEPARRVEEIAQVEAVATTRVVPSEPQEPEFSLAEPPGQFEFGPRAQASSRLAGALWGIGSVLLALALAAQIAYVYRSDLATAAPALRPWIEAGCRPLGCTIPLPQQANLISIESSELAAERGANGLFTLAAILRNRAPFVQAYPSLELTLTDTQERSLARRVLRPEDYVTPKSAREAGLAANGEYVVRAHIDAADLGAAGYRLYAFYE